MKYKDFFSVEFISLLNEKLSGSIETDGIDPDEDLQNSYVDIEDILQKMGFEVQYEELVGVSGQLNANNNIIINKKEVEERQRFTMAHELGHAFQGQVIAFRKKDSSSYPEKDQKDEIFANKFAAQLLMPKALVVNYAEEYIKEKSLNQNKLTANSVDEIISHLAEKLKVSVQSMRFRSENLNLFIKTAE
ncbi:ImmA/IrrE family metallo-endopeptidase [Leuconostoc citreum]|uniref:ImmA/IrrE family metallo-endopeptidase n=1 Tax=Leuconostoc citreum TaxID=33964 RepID=UPI0015F3E801|nr:ImmA/IrrE family metallo-endopeptidase [Leuconostoc citreum]MBA5938534.1 ImmA/IrrE family metallo-endopeptidase [Leuconostoc citreum]